MPEDRRLSIAEFIARANYGLVLGNFELDFIDGELRFKTSIDVDGTELPPELIEPVVYANVLTMDQYMPGIMAVIKAEKTPLEALQMILPNESNESSVD